MVGFRRREVPAGVVGEALALRVDAQPVVVGDEHGRRRVPPRRGLLGVHAQPVGHVGVAHRHLRGLLEVPARHQVGVDVVVHDRAVLVRSGDAVDAEDAADVVMAEAAPQPGGLHQDVQADLPLELLVPGGVHIPDDGVGDVGVDVERGGAGRASTRSTRGRGSSATGTWPRPARAGWRAPPPAAASCAATPARPPRRPARCTSAREARTSRCPRTCARHSRDPSAPSPGSCGAPPAPRPAGRGTARTGPPAGSRRRPRPRRPRPPRSRRGTRAARPAARPSRSAARPPAPRPPGRAAPAGTAGSTTRTRCT